MRRRSWLRTERPWGFSFLLTLSPFEASQLEFQLIKEWMPFYNIKDNDEEEPQVISINPKDAFPALRLEKARVSSDPETLYLGPLVFLKRAYPLYHFLLTKFKLRRCKDREFVKGSKSCLYFQINRCLGPCFRGEEVKSLYRAMVAEIENIFRGKVKMLRKELRALMKSSIKNLDFESAENYYRLLRTLRYLSEKQAVTLPIAKSFSVAESISFNGRALTVVLNYVRGQLISFDIVPDEVREGDNLNEMDCELVPVNRIKSLLRLNLRAYRKILLNYNKREEAGHVRVAGNLH